MKIGDLVITHKNNLCVVVGMESCGIYLDVLFCKSGYLRTGFHRSKIRGLVAT